MLAKIPPRREDLKSSFTDLVEYITNRDEDQKHLSDEVDSSDPHDREKHLKILARAREHLRLAANYLRQSPQIDREFQQRALARRADLGLEKEPIQPAPSQAEAEALAELWSGRLLGQAERLVTPTGVACEHNCLTLLSAAAEMKSVAAQNARVKDAVYHVVLSWPANESSAARSTLWSSIELTSGSETPSRKRCGAPKLRLRRSNCPGKPLAVPASHEPDNGPS